MVLFSYYQISDFNEPLRLVHVEFETFRDGRDYTRDVPEKKNLIHRNWLVYNKILCNNDGKAVVVTGGNNLNYWLPARCDLLKGLKEFTERPNYHAEIFNMPFRIILFRNVQPVRGRNFILTCKIGWKGMKYKIDMCGKGHLPVVSQFFFTFV